jgi:hypothetical protein
MNLKREMRPVFEHPRTVLVIMTVIVISVGHRAPFVELDNSPETFFAADEAASHTYLEMVDTFGADEFVLFELRGASAERSEDLLSLARLTREVSNLRGVVGVLSVAQAFDDGRGPAPTTVTSKDLEKAHREIARLDSYRRLGLVRPEVPALGVLASLVMGGPVGRTDFTAAGERLLQDYQTPHIDPSLIGLTPTNAAFDRETRRALFLFMPAVVLTSLLIGLILFRSVKVLAALFLPVLGAVAVGIAGLNLFGESMNLVTAVLPPLVMAIGFAGAIHLVTHYASIQRNGLDSRDAAWQTIRDKFVPTAFGFITSAIGFGSLGLSDVRSVRVLGLSVAGTLMVTLVMVVFGTPSFLLWLCPRLYSPAHRQRLMERLAVFSLRWRVPVIASFFVIFAVAGLGVPRVQQFINGYKLLSEESRERVAYERLEREGIGLGNLDLWFHRDIHTRLELLDELPKLEMLARRLQAIPLVTATISAGSVVDFFRVRFESATGHLLPMAALTTLPEESGRALDEQLSPYWRKDRGFKVTVVSRTADREETIQAQREAILAAAKAVYPDVRVDLSGHYAMLVGTPGSLLRTLGRSLGVTVIVIAVLFGVLLRSPGLALAGMVCNLLPVAFALGVMGWVGIPMDVATVMTASVVFGLAVDDTFHYLYHRLRSGSIRVAAAIAGQGIVATTLVVAGGFSALGLSDFNPVFRFGLLTAGTVVIALGVDGLLLPALVGRRDEITRDLFSQ